MITLLVAQAMAGQLLTYEEALRSAVQNNPQVAIADAAKMRAESNVITARGLFDPNLNLSGSGRWDRETGFFQGILYESQSNFWNTGLGLNGQTPIGLDYSVDARMSQSNSTFSNYFQGEDQPPDITDQTAYNTNLSVRLTQNLLRGIKLSYNLQTVQQNLDALDRAQVSVLKSEQDVIAQAAEAYWTWANATVLVRLAQDDLANAEHALDLGQARLETGDIAPTEITRLQSDLAQTRYDLLEREREADDARDNLLVIMGGLPGTELEPATEIGDARDLTIDPERAIEVAMAQSYDLQLTRMELERARQDWLNAKHARLPELTVTGEAGLLGQSEQDLGGAWNTMFSADYPFVSVSGNLLVPLGNRAARGSADQAAAEVFRLEKTLEEQERTTRSEVERAVRLLRNARALQELADTKASLAQETWETDSTLFEAGRKIWQDVQLSRASLELARAEAVRARTDVRVAEVRLLQLQSRLTAP